MTVGSGTITIDGETNTINVGTGATIHTTTVAVNQLEVVGLSTFIGIATFQKDTYAKTLYVTDLVVDGGASLGEDITTRNISASGIVTVTGTTDLNGDLDVDGHTELDNLNVSGVSTFSGNTDLNGDLDVDGHTELDNLNVSGVSTFQGNVNLGDNDRLRLGDSQDLQIYHDGSHSYILDNGTGELRLRGSVVKINNATNTETMFIATQDGAVDLYYDGTKKFETTAEGIDVTGTVGGDQLNVSGVSTFAGNVDANGNLDVDGHTELDNVNIAGVLTATSAEFSGNVTVLGDLTYENVS